ncbi:MAG: carbohydrate ABC transporter permease [Roseburia sp.]|nr:carbohydrate ABC transporter permease [Roseburia sp.]
MKNTSKLKKIFRLENLWNLIIYAILAFLAFITLFPFWVLIVGSITSSETYYANGGMMLIPTELDFSAYKYIFAKGWASPIISGYIVTIAETLIGVGVNLVLSAMLAYALSRPHLPGKSIMMKFVFFTTLFSGGLIPSYLLNVSLGFVNNFWVYIIPTAISAFNVVVLRNFFMSIPHELEEAAIIDGASNLRVFLQIVLPLAVPGLATIALFYAVSHWNEWFNAVLYMRDQTLWPLQMYLREILVKSDVTSLFNVYMMDTSELPPSFATKGATTIVTTLPILVLYPFLQRYFVQGMTMGSVKG